jgi:tRNA threonylcarbamoyladenosine biosynthesis protein TsaB
MKFLGIDTSTKLGSIALSQDDVIVAEGGLDVSLATAETILPTIDKLLTNINWKIKDLNGIAIAIGPGSFTGLRVGLATAKGLALANSIPIVSVSSLRVLALNAGDIKQNIVPMLDARKEEVYVAVFSRVQNELSEIVGETSMKPKELAEILNKIKGKKILLGDGAAIYKNIFDEELSDFEILSPTKHTIAANVIKLALPYFNRGECADLASLVPNYIRKSDAELRFK